MATGPIPAKIVMRGTSKQSLHDRFTQLSALAKSAAPQQHQQNGVQSRAISLRNQRLLQELEQRPSVVAALGFGRKQSVIQRLGPRFGRGGGSGYYGRGRGGRQQMVRAGGYNNSGFKRFTPFYNSFNGQFPRRRGFGGGRRGGWNRRQPRRFYNNSSSTPRGGFGFRRGGGFGYRGGRGGGATRRQVSKEQLDREIDAYMAKTHVNLDKELDDYMAEAHITE